jgi:uncharacterized protein
MTNQSADINTVSSFAHDYFLKSRGAHNWEHTLRVLKLCERLSSSQDVDQVVLKIAAYLHDVGRSWQDKSNGEICHALKGVEIAGPLLDTLDISPSQKQNILHCIKAHRFRDNQTPQTIEAKILFDADKLDSIGAIGIARAYLFAGEIGARLHNSENDLSNTREYSKEDTGYREYMVKLRKVKDQMLTEEGRALARIRHDFMENFFQQFFLEYRGES